MQHHAYGIYGELAETVPHAVEFIERTHGIVHAGNPDFEVSTYDTFSIADARALTARAALLPFAGDTKVFIIATRRIYGEAQNALLKLLEEPPSGTIVVIAVARATILLPTVLSRLMPISFDTVLQTKVKSQDAQTIEVTKAAHAFLRDAQAERVVYIKKAFTGNTVKPHILRTNGTLFLDIVEMSVYEAYEKTTEVDVKKSLREGLEDIETLRGYLYEKVTQARMLFEHLALVLPIIDA